MFLFLFFFFCSFFFFSFFFFLLILLGFFSRVKRVWIGARDIDDAILNYLDESWRRCFYSYIFYIGRTSTELPSLIRRLLFVARIFYREERKTTLCFMKSIVLVYKPTCVRMYSTGCRKNSVGNFNSNSWYDDINIIFTWIYFLQGVIKKKKLI